MLPMMIFGLCSLLGSMATFWLPETAGRALPQARVSQAVNAILKTIFVWSFPATFWLLETAERALPMKLALPF